MVTQLPASIQDDVIYPDSDGKPMADNTKQFRWIVVIEQNLDWLFADDPNVFVAGDLLWYPVHGRNTIVTAPDVLVVFGRPKGESPEATLCERGSYQQWREDNIPPQVVFEILSPGNTPREMGRKLLFYDHHGVEEYYIYDPDTDALEGWLRTDGVLDAIETLDDWISPRLGIRFDRSGDELQIFRPDGQRFLSYIEIGDLLNQTRQQAEAERERAEQAEQQLRDVQEQLAQYRDRFGELPNP